MLKNNKGKLILSSALILFPMLLGVVLWNKLPATMATHWGADGVVDGSSGKAFVVFGLPLLLLAVHWLCILFTAKDPGNREQNKKVFGMVLWIVPFASLFANGVIYMTAFGKELAVGMTAFFLIGLMFVFIGNYLPKCKQNSTIGIKVKWTLANEENWNATHRLGGRIWVVCGLLMMACTLLPAETALWGIFPLLLTAAFVPFLYSWLYYKKQVKEGRAPEKVPSLWGKQGKTASVLSLIFAAAVLVGVVWICFTGNIHMQYDETSFTIEASYYSDLTVDYTAIDGIEYRESCDIGVRTNGFGSPRLSMGSFHNDTFGSYTRYSYTDNGPCVVLTVGDKVLVIGETKEQSAEAIYEALCERMG